MFLTVFYYVMVLCNTRLFSRQNTKNSIKYLPIQLFLEMCIVQGRSAEKGNFAHVLLMKIWYLWGVDYLV